MDLATLASRLANPQIIGQDQVGDILVSTVLLPWAPVGHKNKDVWETCLFGNDDLSDVVERYYTQSDAVLGHAEWVDKATKGHIKVDLP